MKKSGKSIEREEVGGHMNRSLKAMEDHAMKKHHHSA